MMAPIVVSAINTHYQDDLRALLMQQVQILRSTLLLGSMVTPIAGQRFNQIRFA